MHPRKRQISPERQSLFTFGTVLMAIGLIVIVVAFIGFVTSSQNAVGGSGPSFNVTMVDGQPVSQLAQRSTNDPFDWLIACVVGMVITTAGGSMRHLAARGVAGSGLVLDPERARGDLEPWARMGGGLLKDAIEESGLPVGRNAPGASATEPDVKVRCPKCRALNDESAKFCGQCAAPL